MPRNTAICTRSVTFQLNSVNVTYGLPKLLLTILAGHAGHSQSDEFPVESLGGPRVGEAQCSNFEAGRYHLPQQGHYI